MYIKDMLRNNNPKRTRVYVSKRNRMRKTKKRRVHTQNKGGSGSDASSLRVNKCPLCSVPKDYNVCPLIGTGTRRSQDDLNCPICDEEFDNDHHKCFSCMNCKYKLCKTCIQDINRSTRIVSGQSLYIDNGVNDNANRRDPIFSSMYNTLPDIVEARSMRHERESVRNYDAQLVTSLVRKINENIKQSLIELVVNGFEKWFPESFSLAYKLDEETNLYTIDGILMTPEHLKNKIIDEVIRYNEFLIEEHFGPSVHVIDYDDVPYKNDIVQYHFYITQAKYHVYTNHELAQKLDFNINLFFKLLIDNYILELCVPKLLYVYFKKRYTRSKEKTIQGYIKKILHAHDAVFKIFVNALRQFTNYIANNIDQSLLLTANDFNSIHYELSSRIMIIAKIFVDLSKTVKDMKGIDISSFIDIYIQSCSRFNHAKYKMGEIHKWELDYRDTVEISIMRLINV